MFINILDYFEYDELSPSCLRWKKKVGGSDRIKVGDVAGNTTGGKHWRVRLSGRTYMCHKIVLWLHGFAIPSNMQVDHKDRNKLNNKIDNLRIATGTQNQGNRGISKNNKSGYKGVRFVKERGKWASKLWKKSKIHHLGYFDCPILAAEAYDEAAVEYFGEFAKPNFALVD